MMALTVLDPNSSGRTSRASNISGRTKETRLHPFTSSAAGGADLLSERPGIHSMLKTTTEIGDIGFQLRNYHGVRSNARIMPRAYPIIASTRTVSHHGRRNQDVFHSRRPSALSGYDYWPTRPWTPYSLNSQDVGSAMLSDSRSMSDSDAQWPRAYQKRFNYSPEPRSTASFSRTPHLPYYRSLSSLRNAGPTTHQLPSLAQRPNSTRPGYRSKSPAFSDITGLDNRLIVTNKLHTKPTARLGSVSTVSDGRTTIRSDVQRNKHLTLVTSPEDDNVQLAETTLAEMALLPASGEARVGRSLNVPSIAGIGVSDLEFSSVIPSHMRSIVQGQGSNMKGSEPLTRLKEQQPPIASGLVQRVKTLLEGSTTHHLPHSSSPDTRPAAVFSTKSADGMLKPADSSFRQYRARQVQQPLMSYQTDVSLPIVEPLSILKPPGKTTRLIQPAEIDSTQPQVPETTHNKQFSADHRSAPSARISTSNDKIMYTEIGKALIRGEHPPRNGSLVDSDEASFKEELSELARQKEVTAITDFAEDINRECRVKTETANGLRGTETELLAGERDIRQDLTEESPLQADEFASSGHNVVQGCKAELSESDITDSIHSGTLVARKIPPAELNSDPTTITCKTFSTKALQNLNQRGSNHRDSSTHIDECKSRPSSNTSVVKLLPRMDGSGTAKPFLPYSEGESLITARSPKSLDSTIATGPYSGVPIEKRSSVEATQQLASDTQLGDVHTEGGSKHSMSSKVAHSYLGRQCSGDMTIPSLNFSRMDLLSKLNLALGIRLSRSMEEFRRLKLYEGSSQTLDDMDLPISARSGDRSLQSFGPASVADNFGGSAIACPWGASESLISELNRLSIPSVSGLTQRLSELFPTLDARRSDRDTSGHLDSPEFAYTHDKAEVHECTAVQNATIPSRNRLNAQTHDTSTLQCRNSPTTSVAKTRESETLRLMKELPPLPADEESRFSNIASRDKQAESRDESTIVRFDIESMNDGLQHEENTAMRIGDQFQGSCVQDDVTQVTSKEDPVNATQQVQQTISRPWILDEYYPWTNETPTIDITIPSKFHCQDSFHEVAFDPEVTSPVKPQSISDSLLYSVRITRSMSPGPMISSSLIPQVNAYSQVHETLTEKFTILSSLSRRLRMRPFIGRTGNSLDPSFSRHEEQPFEPGDRYPTTSLTSPVGVSIGESRSYFSDDSSESKNEENQSSRKRSNRLLQPKKGFSSKQLKIPFLRNVKLDRSYPGTIGAHSTASEGPCSIAPPAGMSKMEVRARRTLEQLRKLWDRSRPLMFHMTKVKRPSADWLKDEETLARQ